MKGTREGDDAVPARIAPGEVIAPRGLDRAFKRLRARVLEKDVIGKAVIGQAARQALAIRDPIEVRHMPELFRLFGQSLDKVGMAMAERVHRDACRKIEMATALGIDEPHTVPALESNIGTVIDRKHGGSAGGHGRTEHLSGKQKRRLAAAQSCSLPVLRPLVP
jgi:hypothetical protein